MPAPLHRTVAALATALLLAAVTACGGSEDVAAPKRQTPSEDPVKTIAKGTCWGDEQLPAALGDEAFSEWVDEYADGDDELAEAMQDDAAFATEIPCTDPHSLEVYDVVELSGELTGEIEEYADVLDQDSELYHRIRDQVNDRCSAQTAYGRAQRKAGGMPVQLGPALNVDGGLRVAWDPFPADRWAEGQQKFVCSFVQEDPGTLMFADLTTKKVPITARVCLNTPSTYVPCSKRHQAEDIGEMILNTAIEQGKIRGKKAVRTGDQGPYVALSDAEYAKLDKVCQTLLTSVTRKPGRIEAKAYPGAVSQWPTERGAYLASCFALEPVSEPPPFLPGGTVFDRG